MRDIGMVCLFGAFVLAMFPDESLRLLIEVIAYVNS